MSIDRKLIQIKHFIASQSCSMVIKEQSQGYKDKTAFVSTTGLLKLTIEEFVFLVKLKLSLPN